VDRHSLSRTLCAGYIEQHLFDLERKLFSITVHVLEDATLSVYDVQFLGVSRFLFEDNQAGEWERLQLTELWLDAAPEASGTEEWEVTLSLWDLAHISVKCTGIVIDGEPLR